MTAEPGETLVVRFATRIEVDGASAVTLDDDDTTLANSGEIRSFGPPAVHVVADRVTVVNDRDVAEDFVDPLPPPTGGVILTPGQSLGAIRTLPDGTIEELRAPAGPLIRSDTTAVNIVGQDAEIVNNGEIRGDFNGVNFANGGVSSGVLENTGLITSQSRAVNIGGDGIALINEGLIETTEDPRNGVVYTDVTSDNFFILNASGGVITAPAGGTGDAVSIELGEEVTGFLVNDGDIVGRGEASGVWIYSPTGGPATFNALIDNSGSITAEATTGIDAGVLVEAGVNFVGELNNSGSIFGVRNGVYFGDGDHSKATIVNTGRIASESRAVNIDGVGLTLENDGDIQTTRDARNGVVYANNGATGYTIRNGEDGVIGDDPAVNADAVSLEVDDSAEGFVYNHGRIAGTGEAVGNGQASGVRVFSANPDTGSDFTGEIRNHEGGQITAQAQLGVSAAILIQDGVNFSGRIVNEGLVVGDRNGVYVGDGEHDLTLFNGETGRILSAGRAVNIDGTGVHVVNEGVIASTGGANQIRNGVVYSDDTANHFSILNKGQIDARPGVDGDAVSLQLGSSVRAEIVNEGEIYGAGVPALSGQASGLRLFSGVDGPSTFSGVIRNEGLISSQNEAAILIEEGVRVRAEIVNHGELNGPRAFDASASDFGLRFTQTGGSSVGDLLFGDGADTVTISGGQVTGVIDLGDGRNRFDGRGADSGLDVKGGRDRDLIKGGDEDDALDGGGGLFDLLTGGDGADTFRFGAELLDNGRRDIALVSDFDAGEDSLDIDASQIAGTLTLFDVTTFRFEGDGDLLIVNGLGVDDLDMLFA
jgi:hypothetical protein